MLVGHRVCMDVCVFPLASVRVCGRETGQRWEKQTTDKHIGKLKKACDDKLTYMQKHMRTNTHACTHKSVSSPKYLLAFPLVAVKAAVNRANL